MLEQLKRVRAENSLVQIKRIFIIFIYVYFFTNNEYLALYPSSLLI